MSKDRLEDFIDKNREEFDAEMPGLNLWAEIDRKVNPKPKPTTMQKAGRAVAAIVVIGIVCFWFFSPQGDTEPIANLNESPTQMLEDANPELAEMSEYFKGKIDKNKGKLAALNHHDPDLYRELNLMEAAYDTLWMEWERNPHKSDEKLIDAMVANYRTRAMLLEDVVNRLENHNDNNSISTARPALFREW